MAARWMQSKMLKLKRDGMRDSRGPFERFKDEPCKTVARIHPGDGWYLTPKGEIPRGLAQSYGPFATPSEAVAFATRGKIRSYNLRERATVKRSAPPTSKAATSAMMEQVRLEHEAHLAAQRELSRATREALGKKTGWAR